MDIGDKFPHIYALAHGTISGRFSEWPKLAPEARAILAAMADRQREITEAYAEGYKAGARMERDFSRTEGS